MTSTRIEPPASEETSAEGGLLIRVWTEQDADHALRARVLTIDHGADEPLGWATVTGEAAVLAAVQQWLVLHRRDDG